jgi:hypothetical protein
MGGRVGERLAPGRRRSIAASARDAACGTCSAAGSTHSRWFDTTRSSRSPRCTGSHPMNSSRTGTRHAADPNVPSTSGTPSISATYRSTRPDAATPSA